MKQNMNYTLNNVKFSLQKNHVHINLNWVFREEAGSSKH